MVTLKTPAHPGESALYDCIEPLGLSITAGPTALGISCYRLSEITKCRAPVTSEIAIRLSKAFGGSARVWYGLQTAWDMAQAEGTTNRIETQRKTRVLSTQPQGHNPYLPC